MKRTWFFAYMPYDNATARQRAYLIGERLRQAGWDIELKSPLGSASYRRYATPRGWFDRLVWAFEMLMRRVVQTAVFRRGDIAVVQREMMPIGPPVLEHWLRRKAGALLLDLDDATYASAADRKHSAIGQLLIAESKFESLVALSDGVVCGSPELQSRVASLGSQAWLVPTSLEFPPLNSCAGDTFGHGSLVLGWLGNPGNLWTLGLIAGALRRLEDEGRAVQLRVMSSRPPTPGETGGVEWSYQKWSLEEEEQFLKGLDVGVMPLSDDEYSRAKCGFKTLRYISAGVPVIVSPVGVNADIVIEGLTGLVASSAESWFEAIARFMDLSWAERTGLAQRAYEATYLEYGLERAASRWAEILGALD